MIFPRMIPSPSYELSGPQVLEWLREGARQGYMTESLTNTAEHQFEITESGIKYVEDSYRFLIQGIMEKEGNTCLRAEEEWLTSFVRDKFQKLPACIVLVQCLYETAERRKSWH